MHGYQQNAVPTELIVVGHEFKNSDAFREFLTAYEGRTSQKFCVSKSDYRKDQNGKPVNKEYDRLTLACHRGKKRRTNATGVRPFQQTFKNECPVQVRLSYHVRTDSLVVMSANLRHNHELVEQHFALLPSQRKLNATETEKAKELLSIGTSAADVRNAMMQISGKKIHPQDIHNIRTRERIVRRAGRTTLDMVESAIKAAREKDEELMVRSSVHSTTKELEVIVFVTQDMKASYKR